MPNTLDPSYEVPSDGSCDDPAQGLRRQAGSAPGGQQREYAGGDQSRRKEGLGHGHRDKGRRGAEDDPLKGAARAESAARAELGSILQRIHCTAHDETETLLAD